MMNKRIVAVSCAVYATTISFGAGPKDDAAIKSILTNLEIAWNKGDAKAWSDSFAPNADFTVWSGLRVRGRDSIRSGHEGIFKGPYKGTKLKFEIDGIRWIRSDVAIVLTKGNTPGGKAGEQMKQMFAISRHGKVWLVDAFQNTRVQAWGPPSGERQ